MLQRIGPAVGLVTAVGLLGCSDTRPAVEMYEVSGRVTVNGRPAEKLIMNLTPLTPGEGREDDCVVQHGEYRVKLIAGRYKVAFTPTAGGPAVPTRYRSVGTSGLTLDGTKAESEPVNFDLK